MCFFVETHKPGNFLLYLELFFVKKQWMRLFRQFSTTVRFKLHLEYSIMGSSSTWNSWFMMNSFCPLAREKYTHFAVASFFSLFFFCKK